MDSENENKATNNIILESEVMNKKVRDLVKMSYSIGVSKSELIRAINIVWGQEVSRINEMNTPNHKEKTFFKKVSNFMTYYENSLWDCFKYDNSLTSEYYKKRFLTRCNSVLCSMYIVFEKGKPVTQANITEEGKAFFDSRDFINIGAIINTLNHFFMKRLEYENSKDIPKYTRFYPVFRIGGLSEYREFRENFPNSSLKNRTYLTFIAAIWTIQNYF